MAGATGKVNRTVASLVGHLHRLTLSKETRKAGWRHGA